MYMYPLFIYTIAALLTSFNGSAQIIETRHIADVVPLIDEETWFLVDLDNTLFEAKQALGHANWFYDEVQQRLDKGLTREDAIREAYPGWIKTQAVCPIKPLEEGFVPALLQLQKRGVVVMGLTHRQPPVADATLRQVSSLGLDFMTTAPSDNIFTVPAASPTLYKQGILFVSDYNKKGDVFPAFLSLIKQKPKKVVFIDDKKKNVDELEHALAKLGIEYIGIYYTAIEYAKPVYSKELAEFQLKFLDKIVSNEAASLLMQYGLE